MLNDEKCNKDFALWNTSSLGFVFIARWVINRVKRIFCYYTHRSFEFMWMHNRKGQNKFLPSYFYQQFVARRKPLHMHTYMYAYPCKFVAKGKEAFPIAVLTFNSTSSPFSKDAIYKATKVSGTKTGSHEICICAIKTIPPSAWAFLAFREISHGLETNSFEAEMHQFFITFSPI